MGSAIYVQSRMCVAVCMCASVPILLPLCVHLTAGSVLRESHVKGVRVEDLKLPPIVDFAVENTRADNWDSVVTCHTGSEGTSARTWHLHHHCIGKHSLKSKFVSDGAKPVVWLYC